MLNIIFPQNQSARMTTHCPGQLGVVKVGSNYWNSKRKFIHSHLDPTSNCPHPLDNTVYSLGHSFGEIYPVAFYDENNNHAGVTLNIILSFAKTMNIKVSGSEKMDSSNPNQVFRIDDEIHTIDRIY